STESLRVCSSRETVKVNAQPPAATKVISMRYSALSLVSAVVLLLPGTGQAQPRIQLRIETIQVGFGSSAPIAEFKSGFWTPVYIGVMAGPQGTPRGDLVVESVDSDDVPNRYTVPLPQLEPNEQETILAFTKPGSTSS